MVFYLIPDLDDHQSNFLISLYFKGGLFMENVGMFFKTVDQYSSITRTESFMREIICWGKIQNIAFTGP